jgi:hypothetical protein
MSILEQRKQKKTSHGPLTLLRSKEFLFLGLELAGFSGYTL